MSIFSILANSETLLGWSNASIRSAAHQSLLYADGTRDLLFSRNSPKPMRISPLSQTETTLSLMAPHSFTVSTLRNSPSSRITIGPSISVQGVTAQAFPGLSIFICVPTERKPPAASIDTGFRPAAANPVALLLPYLSLNPPGSHGSPNIGRPAMTSSIYLEISGICLLWKLLDLDGSSLPFLAN